MKLLVKRCRTCGALGVGPRAVRLTLWEGAYYCEVGGTPKDPGHLRQAMAWSSDERPQVVRAIESTRDFHHDVFNPRILKKVKKLGWRGYIEELCGLAGWALEVGDRRTFVHYASRAVLAWGLKEMQDAE